MDRRIREIFRSRLVVDRIAQDIPNAAQDTHTDRCLHRLPCRDHLVATAQSIGRLHRDTACLIAAQVGRNLKRGGLSFALHRERGVNLRHSFREVHIDDRTDHLFDDSVI